MQLITYANRNQNREKKNQRGYLTLVSVLVVGAVGVSIAVSILLLSTGAIQTSYTTTQSEQALGLAEACAEQALQSLRLDVDYAGSESISLGQGSCEILAIGGSGYSDRTVKTTGTVDAITKKIEIEVAEVASPLVLTSWQELADL